MDLIDIPKLAVAYFEKYNKTLIGKELGQFSSDLESDLINPKAQPKCKIHSVESIYLGKKAYIECMRGENGLKDYHIRMKGVTPDSIHHYAEKHFQDSLEPLLDVYKYLYNEGLGENIAKFDLCLGEYGRIAFDFKKDMTVHSTDNFSRCIKFSP